MVLENRRDLKGGRRLAQILMASLAIPAFGLTALPAAAQTAVVAPLPNAKSEPVIATSTVDWSKFMTGDWYGERARLHDMGYDFRFDMVNEGGTNLSGGYRVGSAYAQQVGAGFSVDTHKAFGFPQGGQFVFYMTERAGSPLSYYTNNAPTSASSWEPLQIYGQGQNFRISVISYEQKFLEDKVSLKAGFFPYGNEFAFSKVWTNFVNTEFCAHMLLLPNDASGWYDAPRGAWTTRLKVTPTANTYAMIAISPDMPQLVLANHGWDLSLHPTKGATIPVEFGYAWGLNPTDLGGSFKLGGYFDTAHGPAYALYAGAENPMNRYGGYVMVDQQVYRTNATGDQGLIIFAQAAMGDHTSGKYQDYYEAGLTWKGTFHGRENDTISFAAGQMLLNSSWVSFKEASLGPSVNVKKNMSVFELNYGIQLAPWMNLKPFVQYQTNPGAITASKASELYPNSTVIGLETKFNF